MYKQPSSTLQLHHINITFVHVCGLNLPIATMMLSTFKLTQSLTGSVFQIVERMVLGCYQDGSGMVEKNS